MTEILEIEVTFSLPDWIFKYDYNKRTYFNELHKWAGQIKSDTTENEVADYLWEHMKWDEICLHQMGSWVKFKVTTKINFTMNEVLETQHKLHEILEEHFKSGKRKPHGNIY